MEIRRLLGHALPYCRDLTLVIMLSLLAAVAGLAIPWLAAQMLGGIVNVGSNDVGKLSLLLISTLITLALLTMASSYFSSSVAHRIQADFRRAIYAHMQRLPLSFFDQSSQGDLLALMTWEVSRLGSFISGTLTAVPAAVLTGVGATAVLFSINPLMAAVIPLLIPIYYIVLKLIGRRLRSLANEVRMAEAAIFASAEQDLEMLPATKAFAREDIRLAIYTGRLEQARTLTVREAGIYAILSPAMSLVTAIAAVALLLLAGRNVAGGNMTAPELFSFLLYAALLTRPVGTLSNLYGQFQTARGMLGRLHHVLDEALEPGYTKAGQLESCRGEIVFRNVWFAYPGRNPILRGVDFRIVAGEVLALTGQNGAGKSTIVNLLLGFYEPTEGAITIDGADISTLEIRSLREAIGYVPQRPLLLNGSIRENIVFDLEGVRQEQLEQAARLAQALQFIENLPEGFETQIGDHGVRLSGGQRQRIALARVILKEPQILILDEATSMFDLEGEAAFVEACKNAFAGRTVIVITHRPASLALVDYAISISEGRATKMAFEFESNLHQKKFRYSDSRPDASGTLL